MTTFLRSNAIMPAVSLICGCAALIAAGIAPAAEILPQRSGYAQFTGEPFFLLADSSFGSKEIARVRLEVAGRDTNRASLEPYSGVDIAVYRVPAPLEFLKKQSNLHRVQIAGNYQGEGLANTLSFLWDSWWKQSRLAWRQIFSSPVRQAVTQNQPALATNGEAIRRPTEFRNNPQYKALKGYEMVEQFRYPLWQAKPIEPPKGVKLDGSSSDFIKQGPGNLMIPIGAQKPGLYLVEAFIGQHRATTLVFVSDTVAVTKIASGQMLVWTARRDNGAVVPGVNVAWTDGTGILQSGKTGDNGVAMLERSSPEHTYVLGEDAAGGVFVSENFYYDSEIYNTKIYAVTDRPLYRPGDEVNVKFIGREFKSSRVSQAAAAGDLQLTVFDPNGTPVLAQKLQLASDTGADTRFTLPENATAGGYELQFTYKDTQYGAAFRVAEYVKPHFEIDILPGKPEFKTGEAVSGKIQLSYPDGKPVRNARLSLSLRAQQNTMVEGELRYSGLFPVQLKTMELVSDGDGSANFSLPEAKDPSRYILTVLASDGAAYRVKTTRELMIERSASVYRLKAQSQFSNPNEVVRFELIPEGQPTARPVHWEMAQLEKQQKTEGVFDPSKTFWDVNFPASGSYTLTLRDEKGNILAASSHWVSGDGVKATPGSVEIVLDHERYKAGDTAQVLITFSEPVEQALLTLERDKVEQVGLLSRESDWIKPLRVAPNQWRASLPVKDDYGPNITFSVAYAKNGDYVFQNQGLQIVQPQIALQFKTDKEVYQPGDKVTLDVTATLDGKPVAAMLALGVVDEMIYVLQPEIAPEIGDFFYHPRRNNVRTTASLAFISYDQSQGLGKGAPARHNYNERGIKILERPRRDNIDTAFWQATLNTDAGGRAQVSFTMPDALTRWRITGRAIDAQGVVGQRTAYLRSDKAFYAKWTSPDWMRAGDVPQASVAVFNQTADEQAVEVTLGGNGPPRTEKLKAKRGINYVSFPLVSNTGSMRLEVKQSGKLVDALDTSMKIQPVAWNSPRVLTVPLGAASNAISLPADAGQIRVSFAQGAAAQFSRIADDLIDYPYGCVEQTASRLIPLALGVQNIGSESGRVQERLMNVLQAQRLRLVSMAGPKAVFGWWGNATVDSALMTAYAYYADWYAARALKIDLPPEHWQQLLVAYQNLGAKEPPLHRALILWMAQEMGLPVKTLASGLIDQLAREMPSDKPNDKAIQYSYASSSLLGAGDERNAQAFTLALASVLAAQNDLILPAELQARANPAWETLRNHPAPVAQALRMLGKKLPAIEADNVLSKVRADMPTMDRALTLVWTQKSLGGTPAGKAPAVLLDGPWEKALSTLGQPVLRWPENKGVPTALQLSQPAAPNTMAIIQYESRSQETQALPVQVQRRILRMKQGADGFTTEPVGGKESLRSDELYLDEIVLTPAAGAKHRYGLLEVPLPPGASVETGTWGIKIKAEKILPLERSRQESRRDAYVVPVDPLTGEVTVRHLLRFAQKGSFSLPPARFYRMYQPEQKAFEGDGKAIRTLIVE